MKASTITKIEKCVAALNTVELTTMNVMTKVYFPMFGTKFVSEEQTPMNLSEAPSVVKDIFGPWLGKSQADVQLNKDVKVGEFALFIQRRKLAAKGSDKHVWIAIERNLFGYMNAHCEGFDKQAFSKFVASCM
ncbi:hypothetical protein Asfd1_239 [Aeromonas phage Asfd_1]|nr:hypothetical protein Asfd1_239 [Aeromonas phage Asfd_1]